MAANGISTLPTKEARQIAKLNLAQTNRIASGRRSNYSRALLPAPYTGNVAVPDNGAGLYGTPGRPWF